MFYICHESIHVTFYEIFVKAFGRILKSQNKIKIIQIFENVKDQMENLLF